MKGLAGEKIFIKNDNQGMGGTLSRNQFSEIFYGAKRIAFGCLFVSKKLSHKEAKQTSL